MLLTQLQTDALTELLNIGFARTAAALSELTGSRVILDVPEISLCSIQDLGANLATFIKGEVATVQQIFNGPVSGNAVLILNSQDALTLINSLTPNTGFHTHRLDSSATEALTELGNILLNACLSMFGNILQIQISFSVPRLQLDALDGLLHSLSIGREELRYALVIYTAFNLRENSVKGYMLMVLGVASLDYLIQAIESWVDLSVSSS